jgi:hypothetical protein
MSTTPRHPIRILVVYMPTERLIGMPDRVRLGEEAAAVARAALVAALQQGLAWPVDSQGRDISRP